MEIYFPNHILPNYILSCYYHRGNWGHWDTQKEHILAGKELERGKIYVRKLKGWGIESGHHSSKNLYLPTPQKYQVISFLSFFSLFFSFSHTYGMCTLHTYHMPIWGVSKLSIPSTATPTYSLNVLELRLHSIIFSSFQSWSTAEGKDQIPANPQNAGYGEGVNNGGALWPQSHMLIKKLQPNWHWTFQDGGIL